MKNISQICYVKFSLCMVDAAWCFQGILLWYVLLYTWHLDVTESRYGEILHDSQTLDLSITSSSMIVGGIRVKFWPNRYGVDKSTIFGILVCQRIKHYFICGCRSKIPRWPPKFKMATNRRFLSGKWWRSDRWTTVWINDYKSITFTCDLSPMKNNTESSLTAWKNNMTTDFE